jgi:hypothetical protein
MPGQKFENLCSYLVYFNTHQSLANRELQLSAVFNLSSFANRSVIFPFPNAPNVFLTVGTVTVLLSEVAEENNEKYNSALQPRSHILNPGSPKYEAGLLITTAWRSVKWGWKYGAAVLVICRTSHLVFFMMFHILNKPFQYLTYVDAR